MKVYFETYGCAANFNDTEIMKGLLVKEGFEITDKIENADLLIINTCNVKVPTANRMIERVKKLYSFGKPLIIAGCMAKTERERLEKIAPKASFIGPNSVLKIVDVAKETLKGKKVVFVEDLDIPKLGYPRISRNPIIGIAQISQGCLGNCSYCIVKFSRGRLKSYPLDLIVKEVENLVKNGKKEIWITSQDNAVYGFDIGLNLAKLLEKIVEINGNFWIRIGMMNPAFLSNFLDELIEVYKNEKIFKFVHLPVQSGSNKVLRDMKRGYTVEKFIEIVEKFRKEIKDITIATDIIVGYPTEKEEDFEQTIELIEKIKPDIVNISKFGARPLTEASKLKQLDPRIINERSKVLYNLVRKISFENNQKWLGWKGKALVDEIKEENKFVARNFAYKSIFLESKEKIFGKFVEVKVEKVFSNFLSAKLSRIFS